MPEFSGRLSQSDFTLYGYQLILNHNDPDIFFSPRSVQLLSFLSSKFYFDINERKIRVHE